MDQPNGDGIYVIGDRMIRIAFLGSSDFDMRRCAAPLWKTAVTKFNEPMFLARFRDFKVEIIHVETPDDTAQAYIHPRLSVRPIHACSCSKAIATFGEAKFHKVTLSGRLKQHNKHTKITKNDLRAEFTANVRSGFADCDQEIDLGIARVVAPASIGNIGQKLAGLSTRISSAIQLLNVAEV